MGVTDLFTSPPSDWSQLTWPAIAIIAAFGVAAVAGVFRFGAAVDAGRWRAAAAWALGVATVLAAPWLLGALA
jgi:hypothetical protein